VSIIDLCVLEMMSLRMAIVQIAWLFVVTSSLNWECVLLMQPKILDIIFSGKSGIQLMEFISQMPSIFPELKILNSFQK